MPSMLWVSDFSACRYRRGGGSEWRLAGRTDSVKSGNRQRAAARYRQGPDSNLDQSHTYTAT